MLIFLWFEGVMSRSARGLRIRSLGLKMVTLFHLDSSLVHDCEMNSGNTKLDEVPHPNTSLRVTISPDSGPLIKTAMKFVPSLPCYLNIPVLILPQDSPPRKERPPPPSRHVVHVLLINCDVNLSKNFGPV